MAHSVELLEEESRARKRQGHALALDGESRPHTHMYLYCILLRQAHIESYSTRPYHLEPVISFFRPILSYARKIRQQENVGPSGHSAGLPKMRMWAPLHVANRAFEATTEEQHLSLATRSVKSCLLRLGTDGWQSLPFYLFLRFQRALAAVSPDPPFTLYRVKLSPGLGYSWS